MKDFFAFCYSTLTSQEKLTVLDALVYGNHVLNFYQSFCYRIALFSTPKMAKPTDTLTVG